MKIHENKSQFGWENDDGIGEKLIQQILSGIKTATAGPKVLYGSDAEAFKASHRDAWKDLVASGELQLNDETILVVELFKLTNG